MKSLIDKNLLEAYSKTVFLVGLQETDVIIGSSSEDLFSSFDGHFTTCALISSYNPFGKIISKSKNEERNIEFSHYLSNKYIILPYTTYNHEHPLVVENGFAILDISHEDSSSIGILCEQDAIVFCELSKLSKLILLR